jgi:hypothetical protein
MLLRVGATSHGTESAERSDTYKSKHGAQAHHEHRHGRLCGPILHMTIRMERPMQIWSAKRMTGQLGQQDIGEY